MVCVSQSEKRWDLWTDEKRKAFWASSISKRVLTFSLSLPLILDSRLRLTFFNLSILLRRRSPARFLKMADGLPPPPLPPWQLGQKNWSGIGDIHIRHQGEGGQEGRIHAKGVLHNAKLVYLTRSRMIRACPRPRPGPLPSAFLLEFPAAPVQSCRASSPLRGRRLPQPLYRTP